MGFEITDEELKKSVEFFSNSSIEVLTVQCTKINKSQPIFTSTVRALEKHGLDRIKVEGLLESIFVVYYVQMELRKKSINQISIGQIKKNIDWFGQFISYYNAEKKAESTDLSEIKFIRDNTVLSFAIKTLRNLFGGLHNVPKEVVFSYFALLKAIEIGAEKE